MRSLCVFVGALVIVLVIASAGVLRGNVCVGQIGCVGATSGGLTIHGAP